MKTFRLFRVRILILIIIPLAAYGKIGKFKVSSRGNENNLTDFCKSRGFKKYQSSGKQDESYYVVCVDDDNYDPSVLDTLQFLDSSVHEIQNTLSDVKPVCKIYQISESAQLSYRKFNFALYPASEEQSEKRRQLSNELKHFEGQDTLHLAFDRDNNSQSSSQQTRLQFAEAKNLKDIFRKLYELRHFGSFSIIVSSANLEKLKKEYNAIKHKDFPYELQYKAISWPNDKIELKFSPLFYASQDFLLTHGLTAKEGDSDTIDADKVKRHKLQNELDLLNEANKEYKMRLNVVPSALPIAIRNSLDKDLITSALENPKAKEYFKNENIDIMKAFISELNIVTYEDLTSDLKTLTAELKQKLKNRPYSVFFIPEKSSQWLAEMAIPELGKAPATYLTYHADVGGHNAGPQQNADDKIKDYVLFDDFAYSGDQIRNGIFNSALVRLPKEATLHVVVPYISERANEKWATNLKSSDDGRKINILASKRKFHTGYIALAYANHLSAGLPAISSAMDSFKNYFKHEYNIEISDQFKFELDKDLAVTEWKIPDGTSVNKHLFPAFTRENAKPIYKLPLNVRKNIEDSANDPDALLKSISQLFKEE